MTAEYYEWRAYAGPIWKPANDNSFWDWSGLNAGAVYAPESAIPSTTLTATLSAGATTATVAGTSGWPSAGSFFVGPNGSGQAWERISYTGKTATTLTGLVRESVDNEQTGTHSSGAVVRFWWPLETATGELMLWEQADQNLGSVTWRAELSGVNVPLVAVRNRSLILVQSRYWNGSAMSSWTNLLVGWAQNPRANDDSNRERAWRLHVVSIAGLLERLRIPGIKVGADDLARMGTATASDVMGAAYKEQNAGDYSGEPSLAADRAIDGDDSTLWVSDRFVGEDNPVAIDGGPKAMGSSRGITQVHIAKYTGQSAGYRWLEVTALAETAINDWIVAGVDYFVNLENQDISLTEEGRAIFAENPTLFQEENSYSEGTLLDLADYKLWNLNNNKQTVNLAGATGGTFTLTFNHTGGGWYGETTGAIAYNASAAAVRSALTALAQIGAADVFVSGSAGGPYQITFVNGLGSDGGVQTLVLNSSLTGGGTPTVTVDQAGGSAFETAESGAKIFEHLATAGGYLRLTFNGIGNVESQVVWGSGYTELAQGNGWTGAALAAPAAGETARFLFSPSSPTASADYWQVGPVATPGYSVEAADRSWLLVQLPRFELFLGEALDSGTHTTGSTLLLKDASGANTSDGLDGSGSIQIGAEQIAYTAKVSTGIVLAGAVAGSYSEGDKVYAVAGGVATDGLPVDEVVLRRKAGSTNVPEDFWVRGSKLSSVRTPDDDPDDYADDYDFNDETTGNGAAEVTISLAPSQRLRWLLVEIRAMTSNPSRVRLNTLRASVDVGVYGATVLDSGDVAAAARVGLEAAGLPAGAIVDAGSTPDIAGYTTEDGEAWPILADLADYAGCRFTVGRDSKVTLAPSDFWTAALGKSPSQAYTSAEVAAYERLDTYGGVGQVKLTWVNEDGSPGGVVSYPTTAQAGSVLEIGPYVFADEATATLAAQNRYLWAMRPYTVLAQMAASQVARRPGEYHRVTWTLDESMAATSRVYVATEATHRIEAFAVESVLNYRQISRSDDR